MSLSDYNPCGTEGGRGRGLFLPPPRPHLGRTRDRPTILSVYGVGALHT